MPPRNWSPAEIAAASTPSHRGCLRGAIARASLSCAARARSARSGSKQHPRSRSRPSAVTATPTGSSAAVPAGGNQDSSTGRSSAWKGGTVLHQCSPILHPCRCQPAVVRAPAATAPPGHQSADVMHGQWIEQQHAIRLDVDGLQPSCGRCRRAVEMADRMQAQTPFTAAAASGEKHAGTFRQQSFLRSVSRLAGTDHLPHRDRAKPC